jgi:uncharacterized protein (DUF433 family)
MKDGIVYGHITRTPGICGGKPRLAGHRIKVQHIAVDHEELHMTPEQIVAAYPTLTLGEVHAALAYFFDHRREILKDIKADRKYVAKAKRQAKAKVARC